MATVLETKLENPSWASHCGKSSRKQSRGPKGPCRGHTEELRRKTGVCWAVRREREGGIKGESALNEPQRGMRKTHLPLFLSAAPASALTSTGFFFRALTGTSCRKGRCFQMRPDAEKLGGGWPLWVWRGWKIKEGEEMSEEVVDL